MRRGLPALQDLIGIDYPVSGRLSVEEAATSRLGEYAGIYNRVTGVIRVRYDADAFVTLHEAAHLWFNGDALRRPMDRRGLGRVLRRDRRAADWRQRSAHST